ncbi:hypothetical protein [Streptomyces sp. NPDC001843]|uniref:hypothetical protein n=1 Tax=Streptomyces sp. NPDC001843 TaxID=3364617 RepID=UPI0036ABD5A2
MLRHEFEPGKLVAGFVLTVVGVMYAGDAGGAWDTPWFAGIPVVVVGLFLAGAVSALTRAIRSRRGRRGRGGTPDTAEIPGSGIV